jgi:flagellar protein FlaG
MMNIISTSTLAKNVSNIPAQQQGLEVKEIVPTETAKKCDEKQVSKEDLEKVIDQMNEFLEPTYTSVQFKLHEKTHNYYAVLVDSATSEVIKEIPSKKMLDMYAAMEDFIGILFDKKI